MSFILDALKKSETDRQRQSGPALFEVRVAPPRSRIAPWAIGLVLLLVLNLFVLGWVAMRERAPASAESAPAATAPRAAPPAALPGAAQPGPPAASAPAALPAAGADAMPSKAPPLLEEPVLEEADETDGTPPPAPPATSDAVTPANLPTREDLVARGTPVPELRLDMHVYGSRPDERFIFVNMRRLREGESTADGLRIERITPEGAILSWQGRRFLLPKE